LKESIKRLCDSYKLFNETKRNTTPTQHNTGIPSQSIRQEEGIKGIKIGKETVKISLFADDMILYLKDPKHSTQKLPDTINSYRQSSRI
jgi:hypothetical protein